MTEDRFWTFQNPGEQEGTETIEFPTASFEHLTYTGSFDVEAPGGESFSKLLDAFPIPVLLVDGHSAIGFANVACVKLLGKSVGLSGRQFATLFSPEQPSTDVQSILEAVFSDRKPQVAQGTLRAGSNGIWGRVHFRSLRMGDRRSILVLVEDFTQERQSALARLEAEEALRRAHQELEKRVAQRTKELVDTNRRLELEIAQRQVAEDRMGESLREKEALLQEVHHRVKNNLQIISSLLALQANQVSDVKTLGVLQDSQSRIRSMAFIHEHLYQSTDLARIDFSEYIRDLVNALMQSYSETAARVSLKLRLEPAFMSVGTALPCGLVINEIVSNCLKHAFPLGRSGEIWVLLSHNPDGDFELVVADDGIGFPKNLDFRESGSLGLRLMKNLTELQLKGDLEVSSDNGTSVKVVFRDHEHM